jgi:nuclear GTP-binding protein
MAESSTTNVGTPRIAIVVSGASFVLESIANRWLTYLRREFPTVLFKSSGRPGRATEVPLHDGKWRASDSFGVGDLINLLNRYAGGTSLVAGVIGPPNSGKSSLINSLSRRAAAGVAATPGFTRSMQEIEVTSRIRILDCPGVVPGAGSDITPSMVLRNAIKIELLEDPVTPVAFIVDRVPKEQLVGAYGIGSFADAEDFLAQLARRRGRLLKGGEPDVEGVARAVLSDWNRGCIRYYTLPPTGDDPVEGRAELVTQWGEVYQMGRTMDFGENDLRNFQIQHICEIVQRRKAANAPDAAAEDEESSGEDERVVPGGELPPEEQVELDQLAEEYKGISFSEL